MNKMFFIVVVLLVFFSKVLAQEENFAGIYRDEVGRELHVKDNSIFFVMPQSSNAIAYESDTLAICTFSKVEKGKKMFKVKYTKIEGATGFQVQFKRGKSKWITKTFKTQKSATKAIKKLKKGKYSVQARAFAQQNGVKIYSAWSSIKKVKVK